MDRFDDHVGRWTWDDGGDGQALPWSASKFGAVRRRAPRGELAKTARRLRSASCRCRIRRCSTPCKKSRSDNRKSSDCRCHRRRGARSRGSSATHRRAIDGRARAIHGADDARTPNSAQRDHGLLELLEMELAGSITTKQKRYFARVQRACKHLVGVTNDFLDMAQGDAGRLKVARHRRRGAPRHERSVSARRAASRCA